MFIKSDDSQTLFQTRLKSRGDLIKIKHNLHYTRKITTINKTIKHRKKAQQFSPQNPQSAINKKNQEPPTTNKSKKTQKE